MRNQVAPLILAAVAVLLQVVVAPIIPIGAVYPSFIVPVVLALGLVRPTSGTYVYAFVLGLISDLLSHVPVGLTSALLLVACFGLARAFEYLDRSTAAMPIIALFVALFAYQAVVAVVMAFCGQGGFIDLFAQRALLGTLYDGVIGILVYLVAARLPMEQTSNDAWQVTNTRRFD